MRRLHLYSPIQRGGIGGFWFPVESGSVASFVLSVLPADLAGFTLSFVQAVKPINTTAKSAAYTNFNTLNTSFSLRRLVGFSLLGGHHPFRPLSFEKPFLDILYQPFS